MKSLPLPFLIICLLFSSCLPSNLNYSDANERNNRKLETEEQRKDASFLVEAADYNNLFRELATEASQNAYSRAVSDFAAKNLQDHQQIAERLTTLAKDKKFAIPSNLEERHENILNEVKRASKQNIDRIYLNSISNLHERAIRLYEEAAINANDAEIRSYAASQLDVLRSHSREARDIRNELI